MPAIESKITGLPKVQHQAITEFMAAAISAFTDCKAKQLGELTHEGQKKQSAKTDQEFSQGLMNGGDRITSWHAKPYREPEWEVMSYLDFFPSPTVWVDVTLNNGDRDYPFFFALAPGPDNGLLKCYYVDRE